MILAISSFLGGLIGLVAGVLVGWILAALLRSGKDHEDTLEKHQSNSN